MAETLEELQKKREDIRTLLVTLEEAYNDASITEEHYKEVKHKNEKSLKEVEAKIKKMGGELEGGPKAPEEPAKKGGRPKKGEEEKKPRTVGEMIASEMEIPVSKPVEGEAAAVPLEEEPPKEAVPEKPAEAPAGEKEAGISSKDLEDVLKKFVKELRPDSSGFGDKLEKMAVQLEKLRTFVDAIKDERSNAQEDMRRIMEEIGELRSTVNSLESKTSEQEIKMEEVASTMRYLKTDQFVRDLQRKETELRTHEARIDKADDMLSILVKKVTAVEDAFKDLGSLENVAKFSQGLASKIKEIDDREAKITKMSDRVNSIFIELNKKLEEFMFYKVKQDTLDELSQETMKSLEEVNTKVEGLASKEDLEQLRSMVEQRGSEAGAPSSGAGGGAASPKVKQLEDQREEIEGLLAMLDEQLAAKKMSKAEYEKTKKLNTKRLEDIEKQITEEQAASEAGASAPGPKGSVEAELAEALTAGEAATKPGKKDKAKPAESKQAEKQEQGKSAENGKQKQGKAPAGQKTKDKPGPARGNKPLPEKAQPAKSSQKESILRALDSSFQKGLISRQAYEKTKKMLGFPV
jgi:hypothetical protein